MARVLATVQWTETENGCGYGGQWKFNSNSLDTSLASMGRVERHSAEECKIRGHMFKVQVEHFIGCRGSIADR